MEAHLKARLGYSFVRRTGQGGGGCISQGELYHTDQGDIYVKENSKPGSDRMFQGEFASLEKIQETGTIKVPKPIKVLERNSGGRRMLVEVLCCRYEVLTFVCVRWWVSAGDGISPAEKMFQSVQARAGPG